MFENLTSYTGPVPSRYKTLHEFAAALNAPVDDVWIIVLDSVPGHTDDLLPFVKRLISCRGALRHPHSVAWIQPVGSDLLLTIEEAEQILGLVAGITVLTQDTLPDGSPCYVLGGTVRQYGVGFCIRWRGEVLHNLLVLERLTDFLGTQPAALQNSIHFIEPPTVEALTPAWCKGVKLLLDRLQVGNGKSVFGVYLPSTCRLTPATLDATIKLLSDGAGGLGSVWSKWVKLLLDRLKGGNGKSALGRLLSSTCPPMLATLDMAMMFLSEELASHGFEDSLRCLWIGRFDATNQAKEILDIAGHYGLDFDFSMESGTDDGIDASTPYLKWGAYHPMDFDLRSPALVTSGMSRLIELPRCPAERVANKAENELSLGQQAFNDIESDLTARLLDALDIERRKDYLQRLENERKFAGQWHYYHVYNWAPPPEKMLGAITLDSEDMEGIMPRLSQRFEGIDETLHCGADMLELFRAEADKRMAAGASELLGSQISAHEYLRTGGRPEVTADGLRLIESMPEQLGRTLEIGCGYGLTAGKVASRASLYVGMDLRPEQAAAVNDAGGIGLVADMHNLPFGDAVFDTVIADNVLEHAYLPLQVFRNLRRVLRTGGHVYGLVPFDGLSSRYQIRTHLWKVDEKSLAQAAALCGFRVKELATLEYQELGIYGCFPASRGKTCLVVLEAVD